MANKKIKKMFDFKMQYYPPGCRPFYGILELNILRIMLGSLESPPARKKRWMFKKIRRAIEVLGGTPSTSISNRSTSRRSAPSRAARAS
jgi:hypothetical protein